MYCKNCNILTHVSQKCILPTLILVIGCIFCVGPEADVRFRNVLFTTILWRRERGGQAGWLVRNDGSKERFQKHRWDLQAEQRDAGESEAKNVAGSHLKLWETLFEAKRALESSPNVAEQSGSGAVERSGWCGRTWRASHAHKHRRWAEQERETGRGDYNRATKNMTQQGWDGTHCDILSTLPQNDKIRCNLTVISILISKQTI